MKTYLAAKRAQELKLSGKSNFREPNQREVGNYQNEVVEQMYSQLGPFDYNMAKNVPFDGEVQTNSQNFPHLNNSTQTSQMKGWRTLEGGAKYNGEWDINRGVRQGKGTQIWPDGSRYDGYWMNDRANGPGRLIHAEGDVYQGDWVDDKAHGWGQYISAVKLNNMPYGQLDCSTYEGYWQNDKQHGRGREQWPDTSEYEGDYVDGKKHGTGRFSWADGSVYEGEFYDNNIQGRGKY